MHGVESKMKDKLCPSERQYNAIMERQRHVITGLYMYTGASMRENLSSSFPTIWDLNQPAQLQRQAKNWNLAWLKVDYYYYQIANNKVLIRLCGCAGWAAPLLVACNKKMMFSRIMAHICVATWDFQQCGMRVQQRLRPACAHAQSDQSLCLSLEYYMNIKLLNEHYLEFLSLKEGYTG